MSEARNHGGGGLTRAFAVEATDRVWQDRGLRELSDDELLLWREHLLRRRDKPEPELTPNGVTQREAHEKAERERNQTINRIDDELTHRLYAALRREGKQREDGWER